MAIENTSLIAEVDAIVHSRSPLPFTAPRAELTAGGENIPILKVMALEIRRAYATSHSDVVFLDVVLMAGTFAHRVFPNKDDLFVTLHMDPVRSGQSDPDLDEAIETQTFRAVLHDTGSEVLDSSSPEVTTETTLNLADIRQYRLELIDLATEQMRMMTVGTVLHNTEPGESLRTLMTRVIQDVVIDEEQAVSGVEMVDVDNVEPFRQMIVPHGTPILDLADLFQNTAGLYTTGIGSYLQKKTWHVFPLYDVTRFDHAEKTLTLINVPRRRFSGMDRTFRMTANQIIALVTGEVRSEDATDVSLINEGNGVRFADPDRVFQIFGISEGDNKSTAVREEVVNEIIAVEPKSGLNYAPIPATKMTSNRYRQLSELAVRKGSFIVCQWEFSIVDAIVPGMPVKFLYEVDGSVTETQGQVLEVNHYLMSNTPGLTRSGFTTQSVMLLFVDKKIEWNDFTGDTDT